MATNSGERSLVTCTECDGDGTVDTLGGPVDGYEGDEPEMTDLSVVEAECRRCGGRGTEYDGIGCPRCGAASDSLSSSLMPCSSYEQRCSNCGWSELVG